MWLWLDLHQRRTKLLSCSPLLTLCSLSWEECFLDRVSKLYNPPSNSPFPPFCTLCNSNYGLSESSNAWENCHLTPPQAPASSLCHSQFLNGLSFSLILSPVFCQAGRLILWRQTKGWFSPRPVSRSPHRQHGSLGWRHQTRSDQKKKSHTHRPAVRETMADGSKKTEPQCSHPLPLTHPWLQKAQCEICRERISSFSVHKSSVSLLTRKWEKIWASALYMLLPRSRVHSNPLTLSTATVQPTTAFHIHLQIPIHTFGCAQKSQPT